MLLLAGCISNAPPPERVYTEVRPAGEVEVNSIGLLQILAEGLWRRPVDLEMPRNIGHLYFETPGPWRPKGEIPLELLFGADSLDEGLGAALAAYNARQEADPGAAHVQFELVRYGEHRVLLPTRVWGPDQTWVPAERPLDVVLALEGEMSCKEAFGRVLGEAWRATPDRAQAGAHLKPHWTESWAELACTLRGTRTAREHLLDVLAQVDTLEPGNWWSYRVLFELRRPPEQGCLSFYYGHPDPVDNLAGDCNVVLLQASAMAAMIGSTSSFMRRRHERPELGPVWGYRAPLPPNVPPPNFPWLPEYGERLPAPRAVVPAPEPAGEDAPE
ncbi:MAG: hypothetical protein H6734_14215 [Alphaproteobacteria bacterium]|nr:hypothetical protein [Alphaproteobacteria bacterium]